MADLSCPLIAGVVHATRGPCAWACAVLWDVEDRSLEGHVIAREAIPLPYRPGRLAYAVGPAVSLALLALLDEVKPPPLLLHGHGRAHPRRFGLACYIGRLHGLTTVGVAEKLLVGEHDPVPARRGTWKPVTDAGEVIGAALRTRAEAKILYVSVGHGCELEEAIELVLRACSRWRWPEPLRQARMRLKPALRHRLELHRRRWQQRFGLRRRD